MSHEYLVNTPIEEAVQTFLIKMRETGMKHSCEEIRVQDAVDRILTKAVYAKLSVPHYNACAMDGIALKASSTYGASETSPVTLQKGEYIRVDTGDQLLDEYNSVIMIEDVVDGPNGEAIVYAPAVPWQHIRQIGEDICAGDMILPSFSVMSPASMGAMLAGGIAKIEVTKRPVVGIIPTGDEIVPPNDNPKPGEIMEFNSTIFSGMLTKWGAVPKQYPIVVDKLDAIKTAIENALVECDIVLLGAGSSAGRDDYATRAISEVGELFLHGIAIRPGKPTVLGNKGNKPIIGVPGYPVSGIIVMENVVKPLVDELLGQANKSSEKVEASLSRRLNSSLKYKDFIRTSLNYIDKRLVAVPLNSGAGVVTSFVKADGIIELEQDCEGCEAGERVVVNLSKHFAEIERKLCVVGSHDPLIDELADILRKEDKSMSLSSAHVGSMGGIMAIKRGEAHLGGIHLLDEIDGSYNVSYVKRHFPNGGVCIVECVMRSQGFMVAPGNPHGISHWADIVEKKLRYVNRQKGSGTRILCDHLLKREGVSPTSINGYEREEFTHTNTAAIISSGSADVALGINSAAKTYGLDFIPICEEKYDLLVAEHALEHPVMIKLIEKLSSDEFAQRLNALGGYKLLNSGRILRI